MCKGGSAQFVRNGWVALNKSVKDTYCIQFCQGREIVLNGLRTNYDYFDIIKLSAAHDTDRYGVIALRPHFPSSVFFCVWRHRSMLRSF